MPRSRVDEIIAVPDWITRAWMASFNESIRARVQFVVVDDSTTEPHHLLLERTVRTSPQWRLARTVPVQSSSAVRVYERTQPLPPGKPEFELDTQYSLGRNLKR